MKLLSLGGLWPPFAAPAVDYGPPFEPPPVTAAAGACLGERVGVQASQSLGPED